MFFKKSGFTLIELLVVIAIIGMLSSVVLTQLNNARGKSRDTFRKASLKQLSNALELYYDNKGVYPPGATASNSNYCTGANAGNGYSLTELMVPTYIPEILTDPKYPTSTSYTQCLLYVAGQSTSGSTYYYLYATLENPSANDLATMDPSNGTDSWLMTNWGGKL
jgi:prepilin-type N-terminal cleavage/methylation domain-containing protein